MCLGILGVPLIFIASLRGPQWERKAGNSSVQVNWNSNSSAMWVSSARQYPVKWLCLRLSDLAVRYFSWLCTSVTCLYFNKALWMEAQPRFSSLFYAFLCSSAFSLLNNKAAEQQSHNFLVYCRVIMFVTLKTTLKGGHFNSSEARLK